MTVIEPPMPSLDDATIEAGVAAANIPTLLLVTYQITGDRRWLEPPFRPRRNEGLGDNSTGGFEPAVQQEIRLAAQAAIRDYRDGASLAISTPTNDQLVEMLSVSMGEDIPREYGPMIADDLGLLEESPTTLRASAPKDFSVLIIGAGLSGIAIAGALQSAGVPYTVIERNEDVGGTWLQNKYPGCGVDTPSAVYSYSFQAHPWSRYFALRDEVESYLQTTARDTGIYPNIRFGEEVAAATWDESRRQWDVRIRRPDGSHYFASANFVVSAVGAFSRPKIPRIPGFESFEGRSAHTAEWPDDLDVAGKRVAVVGNGASAMQIVPAIAPSVESLTVYQRSPHWIAPFEQFGRAVPEAMLALSEGLPLYRRWYRIRWSWTFNDRLHQSLQCDPEWPHPERSVSAENDRHRQYFLRYLRSELGEREDLIKALTPHYPPFGKRILLDNGWFRTLTRDNVQLVTSGIDRIEGDTVITDDGTSTQIDVLVFATGFDVVQFLAPMEIRGRRNRVLHDVWEDDDARAYLGMVVPDFPNFAILYGPNVQPGHGGSLVGLAEIQVHYIVDLLGRMFENDLQSVECRPQVWSDYNSRVDDAHARMVWTHPGMSTYYRNSRGRVVVPGPFRVIDVWHMARTANLGDYETA
jgi:4-hydroxyacetophenone monooxygenase